MGADCRVAARDNRGVGEAPSKLVLLIVAYDWTEWLALALIEPGQFGRSHHDLAPSAYFGMAIANADLE
jgi:hypothetical protein